MLNFHTKTQSGQFHDGNLSDKSCMSIHIILLEIGPFQKRFFTKTFSHIEILDFCVTNYYFQFKTSHNELLLGSSWNISSLISGEDSSYSWVLGHALGLL